MALALGATVMVALFGMYESVLDASEQMRRVSLADRGVRVALGVLEDDLRSLTRVRKTTWQVLNDGLEDEDTGAMGRSVLAMTTTATLDFDSSLPHLGVQWVEYVLEDADDGYVLVRRERPFAGVRGDFDWTEVPLLNGIEKFSVQYWNTGFNEFDNDWEFVQGMPLPSALRLDIAMKGDRSYQLVVPVNKSLGNEE